MLLHRPPFLQVLEKEVCWLFSSSSKGKAKNTQELIAASVQVLIEALEAGHSEMLTQYLKAMARFHHYSFGNIL